MLGNQVSLWRKVVWITLWMALPALALLMTSTCVADEDPLDVRRISLNIPSGELLDITAALNDQLRMPVCVEMRLPPANAKAQRPRFKVSFHDMTARAALNKIAEITGSHTWQISKDPLTVNVVPRDVSCDPKWALNRRCPQFKVEDVRFFEAVSTASGLAGLNGEDAIRSGALWSIMTADKLENHWLYKFYMKPVTLTFRGGTLREALNQIAAAMGNAWWTYGERDGAVVLKRVAAFYPITPNILSQPDPPLPGAQ